MEASENIDVFERWMKAHRERDVDKMLTFVTDDIVVPCG